MKKIGLIIKREYWTRVRKKSFIIMTILGPLLFAGIVVVPIWLASSESSDEKVIAVIDESGLLANSFQDDEDSNIRYEYINRSIDDAKANFSESNRYGLLYIPAIDINDPQGVTFFAESNPSLQLLNNIRGTLRQNIRDVKMERSNISRAMLDSLETQVSINTINLGQAGKEQQGNAEVASAVGYVGAFLIYIFIFLYGAQVMRGVIEEKSSRIVEVIISSVRPFQLMVGKVIGVASVGLTQFLLWVGLTLLIVNVAGSFFPDLASQAATPPAMAQMPESNPQLEAMQNISSAFDSVNIPLLISCFIFYFLGGYLMYGALFAAVGSAADSDTDTQQFMLPVSAPLIISIVTLAAILNEPNGTLAFWMSMIPFTSPVVMMMRIPFGLPTWQLILSMVLLVGGFIFTTWIAAKIYRIGILTYGTKVNYKTIGKWLFQ
ncbi:MAG: ABC transporter permease [Tunicatimonas sp.]|uniref:ABC transporter permease n=1 Tax=Tunicatimonas sp. TaxID=1940096 RepID=UPI003C77F1DC